MGLFFCPSFWPRQNLSPVLAFPGHGSPCRGCSPSRTWSIRGEWAGRTEGRALAPARGPSGGRWLGPAPRAPAAAGARSREAAAAAASLAASASARGGLGWGRPAGQTDRGGRARHGGRLVWRGPRGGCPGPRELRAAAPDPVAGRVLGVLHRGVRTHCQRGLREHRQRSRAALRLQRERGSLSLRRRAGPRGLHRLRRLPAAGRALPADQQRPRPPPRRAAGPGLLRALVFPVVRGLLLSHQPVAAHRARARHHAGGGRGAGRHHLQFLLHPQLGGAHRESPTAVPPRHRHVALCHRPAGHRGDTGLSGLPSGHRRGGHRNLPEPALHRDTGHQPQRVPGAGLLVSVRLVPGLKGHPTTQASRPPGTSPQVPQAQCQGQRKWPLWAFGAKVGSLPGMLGLSLPSSLSRRQHSLEWTGPEVAFLHGPTNLGLTAPLWG